MIVLHDPMRPRKSPSYEMTREELRELARKHGVKRGRNTLDTVTNLRKAGVHIPANAEVCQPECAKKL